MPDLLLSGECRVNEIVRDLIVFSTAEQDALGFVNGSARPSYLLVVMNDRSRPLKVDHEPDIWFVETHS